MILQTNEKKMMNKYLYIHQTKITCHDLQAFCPV